MKKVLLVRHADIDLPPAGANPPLNAAGQLRAVELARLLRSAGVTAILTSNFIRTKQTVVPLSDQSGIDPQEAPAPTDLAAQVRSGSFGELVVIAGHSNTVPTMMEALGVPGPLPVIGEREFDNLFAVVLDGSDGKGGMVHLRYGTTPA
jgi:phosphohistidine phosphatase SixA